MRRDAKKGHLFVTEEGELVRSEETTPLSPIDPSVLFRTSAANALLNSLARLPWINKSQETTPARVQRDTTRAARIAQTMARLPDCQIIVTTF
jgi:hypothetical protein